MSFQDIDFLAIYLRKLPLLENLSLDLRSNTELKDKGVYSIIEILKKFKNLKKLDLKLK